MYQPKGTNLDRIMLLGGKTKDGKWTDQVLSFNPTTQEIEVLPPLPKAISGMAAVVIG